MIGYFGFFAHDSQGEHLGAKVATIILFSSSASPAATASRGSASASTPSPTRARPSPRSKASPSRCYAIPLKAGMSIGMLLISVELLIMLGILLFIPRLRGPVLHRLRDR
jgi:K(+)-stimulated pyrophosphate-energized sodium pump